MKLVAILVLLCAGILALGVVVYTSHALPWYYKLFIGAPFVVVLYLLYTVARQKRKK